MEGNFGNERREVAEGRRDLENERIRTCQVQPECCRTEPTRRAESQNPGLCGFKVHRDGHTSNPRGQKKGNESTGCLGHGGRGAAPSCTGGFGVCSVAEADVVP